MGQKKMRLLFAKRTNVRYNVIKESISRRNMLENCRKVWVKDELKGVSGFGDIKCEKYGG